MCTDSIERVLDALRQHEQDPDRGGIGYRVPRFVAAHGTGTDLVDVGNPYTFYRNLISDLVASHASRAGETMSANRPIDQTDVVYLSFLRTGAALDGRIGTALSQLAFLPHLSRLGVTVLLTLPTGTIGRANRKGTRGSPFAVADPFAVDPSLADPLLPDLDATTQYRALVQACAMAGIRCGSIVPAATLALDSPLIGRFPEITYWWDMPPGTPLRPVGHGHAASGSPDTVPGVGPAVTGRFALPPSARAVTRADVAGASLWRSADGLTPATACPDVLVGDAGTYTWADVAGVRFGSQLVPELGPVSPQLTRRDRAVQVVALSIAWRAAVLGERVFWVDVAARIPPAALELASDLAEAWDERSTRLCTLLSSGDPAGDGRIATLVDEAVRGAAACPQERRLRFIAEELYSFRTASRSHDAVVGPWVFCVAPFTRDLPTLRTSMRHHLRMLADARTGDAPPGNGEVMAGTPLYLAGLGDHDTTPPDPALAAGLLTLSWLLPGSIPLLFTGHEHGSELVVNKEFGFNTTAELRAWREQLGDDVVALFNDVPMPWHQFEPGRDLAGVIRRLLRLRMRLTTRRVDRLRLLGGTGADANLVGYRRTGRAGDEALDMFLNISPTISHRVDVPPGWQLVYATSQGPHARPSPGELAPFAAAVYATGSLAAHLSDEGS
jgi:hypothetical protein